jgi:hypothetical protein
MFGFQIKNHDLVMHITVVHKYSMIVVAGARS